MVSIVVRSLEENVFACIAFVVFGNGRGRWDRFVFLTLLPLLLLLLLLLLLGLRSRLALILGC